MVLILLQQPDQHCILRYDGWNCDIWAQTNLKPYGKINKHFHVKKTKTTVNISSHIPNVLFLPKIETEDLQKDKIIYLKQSFSQRGSREAISFLALWR